MGGSDWKGGRRSGGLKWVGGWGDVVIRVRRSGEVGDRNGGVGKRGICMGGMGRGHELWGKLKMGTERDILFWDERK